MVNLFKLSLTVAALFTVISCTTQELDGLNERLDHLEQRVSVLEEIAKASENGDVIISVTPIYESGVLIGYHIEFQKGKPLDVFFGEDGKDGVDGVDGDSMFQSVTVTETEVTFVTSDGQTFVLKRASALSIEFDSSDLVVMGTNSTRNIHYTITSGVDDITIEALSSADIKVKVVKTDAKTGTLQVKTSATIDEYSKVVVLVSNGSQAIMRTLNFEKEAIEVEENTTKEVSDEGGEVTLEFFSNTPCHAVIPVEAQSWISVAPETKAMDRQTIGLIVQPNTGSARSANVIVQSTDGSIVLPFLIEQRQKPASKALLPYDFLPKEIDKTTITEAYFHISDPTTTATVISAGNSEYEPIFFEMIGTVAHFYTTGQVYKSTNFQMSFEGWKALRSLDLSMFDVSESTSMASSFANCYSLQSLNLSSFNTSKVRSFGTMFYNCVNLKSLDVTNFDTSRADSMYGMFENCRSLKSLDVSVFNTSSVTDFNRMFANCSGLKQLDVSGFDTSSTTELTEVFAGCSRLESVNLSNSNTSKVRTTWALFSDCWNIRAIDLSFLRDAPLEILSYMFSNCRSLVYVDLSDLDLSKVRGFDGLFNMCSSLKSVAFPTTPIANVRWMQYMFDACSSLEQVDLSSFDTSNLTDIRQAFHYCTSLKSLDLSHFDTKKVTNMSFLFSGCSNLEHLDISSFDSSNLTEAYSILYNTHKLTYLDLGDFNLENVTIDDAAKWIGDRASSCHIRCTNETKAFLMTNASWLSQDKYIWYTDGSPLPDVQYEPEEGLYCSTNYSKDKTVRIIQLAEDGAGIDLVLMGDAYSDRLIASGKYDADMERAINAIFAVEPFKSFKRLFNIYIVYAVSENEIIGKSTALDCFNEIGPIGSASWAWESYYLCAAQNASPGECSPVIIMNSSISDGAASGFLESTSGDYMNDPNRDDYHGGFSEAVAYISGPDDDRFDYTVRHEFGHSFGFLMDEYSKHTGAITSWQIESWQCCFAYGMWKNVDLVSDNTVKWAKFINDPRYAGTGIGVYEGALYETGAWRPSPESIMNSTDSGFNAPSREAIYYKIHKLAYGRDWNYNFEDFVTYDLPNINADKARLSAPKARMMRATSSFNRDPVFKKSIVTGPDGKERIKIEMN